MDSQFISVLIGIGFVVGLPLLEKWIEKIKQSHRSANQSQTPHAQRSTHAPRASRPPRRPQAPRPQPEDAIQQPARVPVEGERVTRDNPPMPPIADTNQPHVSREDLRKGIIWSIILGKPRGIE